jgi:hypothetical protein
VKRILGTVVVASLMATMMVVTMAPAFGHHTPVATEGIVRNLTPTSVSIDPQTKVVTVEATVRCASEVNRAFVDVEVSQVVGHLHTLNGFASARLACDGRTPFTLRVRAEEGFFTPGQARVFAFARACLGRGLFERCDSDRLSQEVRLSPA